MRTKLSKVPTQLVRWKTQEAWGSVRLYRVCKSEGENLQLILLGHIYYGNFRLFKGKTKVVTKQINKYVTYCTLT